jgi:hypothetical protein
MAFKFLNPNKGPPPLPPKDEQYTNIVAKTADIMPLNNKLSIGTLLTKFPKPLSREAEQSPKEDENISLPWNFQHHIHVDEGYVGLPPSWLTSAFSEDEISQIHARRAAVLHGVGYKPRPPSPTSSLYPSVIQGHRRNKSSFDS